MKSLKETLYTTKIDAIDPLTGVMSKWCGPKIEANSYKEAEEYCQKNELGYCIIDGEFVEEFPINDTEIALITNKIQKSLYDSIKEALSIEKKNLTKLVFDDNFIFHFIKQDFGFEIHVMQKDGKAFCNFYQFSDDLESIYMNSLSVEDESRNEGLGNEIIKFAIKIANYVEATNIQLFVLKDSWMHDWYKRKKFVDDIPYEDDENYIWMKYTL